MIKTNLSLMAKAVIFILLLVQVAQADDLKIGDTVTLTNIGTGARLAATTLKYTQQGSSHQQAVYAADAKTAVNDNLRWQIEATTSDEKLGNTVASTKKYYFKNKATGNYLHSHNHTPPVSSTEKEITSYSKADSNSPWLIYSICSLNSDNSLNLVDAQTTLANGMAIKLQHIVTKKFLSTRANTDFQLNVDPSLLTSPVQEVTGRDEVTEATNPDLNDQYWIVKKE